MDSVELFVDDEPPWLRMPLLELLLLLPSVPLSLETSETLMSGTLDLLANGSAVAEAVDMS